MSGFRTFETSRVSFGDNRPKAPVVDIALVRGPHLNAATKLGRPIQAPAAKPWPEPKISEKGFIPPKPVRPEDIEQSPTRTARHLMEICSSATGVAVFDIKSERRDPSTVKARQIFCWLAIRFSDLSLTRTGNLVGGRDHSTVRHNECRVQSVIKRLNIEPSDCPIAMAQRLWAAKWPGRH
ncbi:hypothetical protein CIW48_27005 [Methylobacterium sp. P1-11]|uniref:helix-turn-helix domain-containing protein n=1 Tax=Methylobacterium sp. P1-11 TaxID=2024616 RepID=UPI0011F06F68|nr:helix-turn-helix domain-containing protein [Methylobacterium sp. P1-11]KAA0117856.1 hypothetical protein CIW48_27005 [Methylobacterium sp. P1-11]